MESNQEQETSLEMVEAALGRRWTAEDSRMIVRRTNFILQIEDSKYDQVLEEQVHHQLSLLLGQNCKDVDDCLVREVVLSCKSYFARDDDKSFLRLSINRRGFDEDDDNDIPSSPSGGIMDHLSVRVCEDGDINGDEEDAEICSICLDNLHQKEGEIATLNCWHEYHADCIKKWLLGPQNFCPLCKKDATRHIRAT